MTDIIFKVIKYGGDEHAEAIALRKEVLYEARGISPTDYNEEDNHIQGGGIGSKMLVFFEQQARNKGFKSIYCHARDTAINFYTKNGYKTEGEMFEQVTIPHIKMRKVLI